MLNRFALTESGDVAQAGVLKESRIGWEENVTPPRTVIADHAERGSVAIVHAPSIRALLADPLDPHKLNPRVALLHATLARTFRGGTVAVVGSLARFSSRLTIRPENFSDK